MEEKETKSHEEHEAGNANHGKGEQGQIEGPGGDGQKAPTRDPQLNLPNVK